MGPAGDFHALARLRLGSALVIERVVAAVRGRAPRTRPPAVPPIVIGDEIAAPMPEVGLAHAGSTVLSSTPKPPKTAGEKVSDDGEGGKKIAEYLVAQKLI